MTENQVSFKDFSRKPRTVNFTLDGGEVFHCAPAIPIDTMQEVIDKFGGITSANAKEAVREFLRLVLLDESFERIQKRFTDKTNPLDIIQAKDILMWLLEVYGLRPSESSPDSSTGSPTGDDGMPSMAGA